MSSTDASPGPTQAGEVRIPEFHNSGQRTYLVIGNFRQKEIETPEPTEKINRATTKAQKYNSRP